MASKSVTITPTQGNVNSFYVKPGDLILDANTREGAPEGIAELAESIHTHGQKVPCLVRRDEDKNLVLIAGFRRYAACVQLGCDIWVTLDTGIKTEKDAFIAGVLENVRLNPNDVQEAKANATLIERFELSLTEVAALYGRANTNRVSQLQKLLTLPQDVQDHVASGKLSLHAALQLTDEEKLAAARAKLAAGAKVSAVDAAGEGGDEGDDTEPKKKPARNAKHLQDFVDGLDDEEGVDPAAVKLVEAVLAFLRGAKGPKALLNAVEAVRAK